MNQIQQEAVLEFRGIQKTFPGVLAAQTCGIQVMHQEISVLQNMTVAENIMIYDMPRKLGFWTDEKRMNQIAREVLDSVGLDYVNPKKPMSGYSLATQQMINLARILSTNPHVVLLDEPTASSP